MHQRFPVLVVDDDQAMPQIVTQAARSSFAEAQFTFVGSAQQAQHILSDPHTTRPNLLILDINLNDTVDGLHLLSQIRADKRLFTLPVVMISANEHFPAIYKSYQTGASSFAHKPFSLDEWKQFLVGLRQYWYETVTLPQSGSSFPSAIG